MAGRIASAHGLIVFLLFSFSAPAQWKTEKLPWQIHAAGIPSGPDKAQLFFFTASWCAPCHKVKPLLSKLTRKNSRHVELVEVDFDASPQAVRDFQVTELPTMILVDSSGKEVIRVESIEPRALEALSKAIEKLAVRRE
ncbi:MAG: thioredoxin family protein [Acidobacteriota bacterium]